MSLKKKPLSEIVVSPNTIIRKAIEKINIGGVRGVFVCDEDRELMGVLMDSDIRRAILKNTNLDASVKSIMNTSPVTVKNTESGEAKRKIMLGSGKLLLPFVDESNRVVDYLGIDFIPDEIRPNNASCNDHDVGIYPRDKILVIGGAGYIGSVLVGKLVQMGYEVSVLDMLLYRNDVFKEFGTKKNFSFIRGDCRDANKLEQAFDGVGAVIHLGEIVGDPACQVNESFTIETNYVATQLISEFCLRYRVKRFIFASSCSVYGQNDKETDENSPTNPISLYARCKREAEQIILSSIADQLCCTILRFATAHGRSYRQRFDLVVNLLTVKALAEKRIQIFGGQQWRPFISVSDICQGLITVLLAGRKKVGSQIFNLGDSRENYQLLTVGKLVRDMVPDTKLEIVDDSPDQRSYFVNFDKISSELNFSAKFQVEDTIKDLAKAYHEEKLYHDYMDPKYHNALSL